MDASTRGVRVKLWGEMACFTRPEFKGERVSYLVPTPSAMRGALSSIFWKPQFDWRVTEIHILKPIKDILFGTNELKNKISVSAAKKGKRLVASSPLERTRRSNLILRDVAYIVRAEVQVRPGCTDLPAKYLDSFNRRVERGQCWRTPLLGSKHPAYFDVPTEDDVAIPLTRDFGPMFFDYKYNDDGKTVTPHFFNCRAENGVIHVPQDPYILLYDGKVNPPRKEATQ